MTFRHMIIRQKIERNGVSLTFTTGFLCVFFYRQNSMNDFPNRCIVIVSDARYGSMWYAWSSLRTTSLKSICVRLAPPVMWTAIKPGPFKWGAVTSSHRLPSELDINSRTLYSCLTVYCGDKLFCWQSVFIQATTVLYTFGISMTRRFKKM